MKRLNLMSLNHARKVWLGAYSDFGNAGCAAQIRFNKKILKVDETIIQDPWKGYGCFKDN